MRASTKCSCGCMPTICQAEEEDGCFEPATSRFHTVDEMHTAA